MTDVGAFLATTRYGLGPAPGDLDRVAPDPAGWLAGQLSAPPALPAALQGLDGSAARIRAVLEALDESAGRVQEFLREQGRDWHLADLTARTVAAVETATPFVERLVHFWSNHFTVSSTKPAIVVAAVAYENEAIRPHVLGRFADMLKAVVGHPAMLVYLDNAQSIGPDSRVGSRRGLGLNENLAREVLELHTLGVDGGYSQDDVRALAEMLTGWSIGRAGDGDVGSFRYRPIIHQPGDKTLLGVRYPEAGQDEAIAALDALARHPATARHLAAKLARHFVADDPPPAVVARLADVYLASDGSLAALAAELVALFASLADPLAKVKTPQDFVVATLRAFSAASRAEGGVVSLRLMGQFPFAAPSPAGWPDRAADWLGPDALRKRIDWAVEVGRRVPVLVSPVRIGRQTIWPVASAQTRFTVESAPSVADGVALLLASPEFQRR
ncbi:MAG: DUF1800 domain-containing protein [Alphaproteobacteria bacterium]